MPIKNSARKYMRVAARKTIQNKKTLGVVKSSIKKTHEFVKSGSVEEAQKWLRLAQKALDKASQKDALKPNTAARKKSRLNKAVKALALEKKN